MQKETSSSTNTRSCLIKLRSWWEWILLRYPGQLPQVLSLEKKKKNHKTRLKGFHIVYLLQIKLYRNPRIVRKRRNKDYWPDNLPQYTTFYCFFFSSRFFSITYLLHWRCLVKTNGKLNLNVRGGSQATLPLSVRNATEYLWITGTGRVCRGAVTSQLPVYNVVSFVEWSHKVNNTTTVQRELLRKSNWGIMLNLFI